MFNGATSWGYENVDTTGSSQAMWLYGMYVSGMEVDYDSPYQRVYVFPMTLGDTWHESWTWNYAGIDEVSEDRVNNVIAQGWVRVQADSLHYYPCTVLQTISTTSDELGELDDYRIIYEWDVPDMGLVGGAVCTIQSQKGESNQFFTDAEHVFREKQFSSVFDNQPPTFANTTWIPSGYNLGPFYVSSRITDPSGVRGDSFYYKIGNAAWQAATHDSMRDSVYSFHIPQLGGSDTVWYYLAAADNSAGHNRGTDPSGAPYQFFARDPAGDHVPPLITGTTQWTDTAFTGPFVVSANVVDSCSVDSVILIYRLNAGPEQPALPDSVVGSNYYLTLPASGVNTFIRYKVRAVDGSPNRNADFDPASGFYSFNVIDATGPTFANTTVWPDTTFPGPFPVQSRITDISGVQWASVFFKYGSASWDSLPADSASTADSAWYFHMPSIGSPMSVRYYVKAADNSQRHNVATDPANAPTAYYTFYCTPEQGIEAHDEIPVEFQLDLAGVNPGGVTLALPVAGHLFLSVYDAQGARVADLFSGSRISGVWQFPLPGGLASGAYVLLVRTDRKLIQRNFVIAR